MYDPNVPNTRCPHCYAEFTTRMYPLPTATRWERPRYYLFEQELRVHRYQAIPGWVFFGVLFSLTFMWTMSTGF